MMLFIFTALLIGCSEKEDALVGFEPCEGCNVILISLDTLRADHLGTYGYGKNTSPSLDRFASQAVLFEDAQSQAPYTLSSHMSMFTALYPHFHKIILERDMQKEQLDPGIVTLPEVLQDEGYTTVWVGPLRDPHLDLARGFERGFEEFIDEFDEGTGILAEEEGYWSEALDWLNTAPADAPFFMFLHSYRPHFPYAPSGETLSRFTNESFPDIITSREMLLDSTVEMLLSKPGGWFPEETLESHAGLLESPSLLKEDMAGSLREGSLDEEYYSLVYLSMALETFFDAERVNLSDESQIEYVKSLYDADIYETDQDFARVLEVLEGRGLLDNTIIIVTSDHGEEFLEHGGYEHGSTLYDEVLYVPLIIWAPSMPWRGLRIDSPVESVDITPTILGLLGVEIPSPAQGVNLVPLMTGDSALSSERARYAEAAYDLKSIQVGDWKLISGLEVGAEDCYLKGERRELYNLQDEPVESENLLAEHPEVTDRLEKQLVEDMGGMSRVLLEISPLCELKYSK